jgi:hypothetical protein
MGWGDEGLLAWGSVENKVKNERGMSKVMVLGFERVHCD